MKPVKLQATRSWVLQAYLAVSPSRPRWCDIEFTAIEGWQRYQRWEVGNCIRDPRLTRAFSKWHFVSAEAAREVLEELLAIGQPYYLRVIERNEVLTEVAVGGFDIEDGTVVRKPDGSVPEFMGKPVPNMVEAMPEKLA